MGQPDSGRQTRYWQAGQITATAVYAALGALCLLVIVVLPAGGLFHHLPLPHLDQGTPVDGVVTALIGQVPQPTPDGSGMLERYAVQLTSGPQAGQVVTVQRTRLPGDPFTIRVGDHVLLIHTTGGSGDSYYIADHLRTGTLLLLAALFVGLTLLVAGIAGARALLALGVSLLIILRFILPGLLAGYAPLTITALGAAVIVLAALYIAHGVTWQTTVALGGTLLSVALTCALGLWAIRAARFTGLASDEASTLQTYTHGAIDPRGLLLSGMVLGTLGMVTDVTVAQAATVFALRETDPALAVGALYRRAMAVGREHIGSLIYTLTLAYSGGALALLMLLAANTEPLGVVLNRELVSAELARTLVGSIGIVGCVPLTTLLAVGVARRNTRGAVRESGIDGAKASRALEGGRRQTAGWTPPPGPR